MKLSTPDEGSDETIEEGQRSRKKSGGAPAHLIGRWLADGKDQKSERVAGLGIGSTLSLEGWEKVT